MYTTAHAAAVVVAVALVAEEEQLGRHAVQRVVGLVAALERRHEVVGVLDGLDAFELFLGHLDLELFLERHDELDEVEAVGVEVGLHGEPLERSLRLLEQRLRVGQLRAQRRERLLLAHALGRRQDPALFAATHHLKGACCKLLAAATDPLFISAWR